MEKLSKSSHNKIYVSFYFKTYSLPCFTELYNLIYKDRKKFITKEITNLLTARALAF